MGFEIEIKFRHVDHVALARRLIDQGATCEGTVEHTDAYLAHPDRDFGQTGEAFRLRQEGDANRITYKGPKLAGPAKDPRGDRGRFHRRAQCLRPARHGLRSSRLQARPDGPQDPDDLSAYVSGPGDDRHSRPGRKGSGPLRRSRRWPRSSPIWPMLRPPWSVLPIVSDWSRLSPGRICGC